MRETNTLPDHLKAALKPTKPRRGASSLDGYVRDAEAGVPDTTIARNAGVSAAAVRKWRRALGIKPSVELARADAVDVFGSGTRDYAHRVAASPVRGMFEVPEYVLRHPLQYEALARHLYEMRRLLGSTDAELAAAFGIRESDVATCVLLWGAHLQRNGRSCCGELYDPRWFCPRCTRPQP